MILKYGKPIEDWAIIERFQAERGLSLPQKFLEIVRDNDGASLIGPSVEYLNPETRKGESVGCDALIPFQTFPGEEGSTMADLNVPGNPVIEDGLIVFAREAGGYLFAFDYRANRDTLDPPVVLINRDNTPPDDVIRLSDSFTEFFDRLLSSANHMIP